jgi:aromatic-L-amino-acid decarboxylase
MDSSKTNDLACDLQRLERESGLLEPTSARWEAWTQEVFTYATSFLEANCEGPAWQPCPWTQEELEAQFTLNEEPGTLREILGQLHTYVDTPGLNPASGGHIGYIPGGGLPSAAMGDFLAAIANRYAGIAFTGPGAVALEHALIQWACGLFGLPNSAGGTHTSGGSLANLIGITCARDACELRPADYEKAVIYGSAHMHHCLHKALRIAGLGYSVLREVPLDERFRMDPQALDLMVEQDRKAGLRPFLLIASAGTTDTGAMDPLIDLARLAASHQLWFHVDAAYGGFFKMLPTYQTAFAGIEQADSIVVDPHKGLFLPYGSGIVLVRDTALLHKSFAYQASYMQDARIDTESWSPADLSPELTRHFRALRMYLPLKLHGLNPFRAALEEKILLCRYFFDQAGALGFQLGPYPDLSVCIFRHRTLDNKQLLDRVLEDGRIFLSSTRIQGEFWIRLAVLSFRTKKRHIDLLLSLLSEALTETDLQLSPQT